MWSYEDALSSKGFGIIAGVDEAGRGPLAGPVVSAAVILDRSFSANGLTDSKKLSLQKRELFFQYIMDHAVCVGVGIADCHEIDTLNILRASLVSMKRAVEQLDPFPEYLLVDGIYEIPLEMNQWPIKKGDSLSLSIAAGSVIAKVTRDRLMKQYHKQYPVYGFDRHNGYPTKMHKDAIQEHGPSPIHRKTFKGVKEYL